MKKKKFAPLSLDKETVNLLDKSQLKGIKGGKMEVPGNSTGCTTGGSACGSGGNSAGCTLGQSTCFA
jgi:hypothetical protein